MTETHVNPGACCQMRKHPNPSTLCSLHTPWCAWKHATFWALTAAPLGSSLLFGSNIGHRALGTRAKTTRTLKMSPKSAVVSGRSLTFQHRICCTVLPRRQSTVPSLGPCCGCCWAPHRHPTSYAGSRLPQSLHCVLFVCFRNTL